MDGSALDRECAHVQRSSEKKGCVTGSGASK